MRSPTAPPRPPRRSVRRLATAAALSAALAGACASKDDRPPGVATRGGVAHLESNEDVSFRTPATDALAPGGGEATARVPALDPHADRGGLDGAPVDNRKVVRTGHIELVVAAYDASRDQVEVIVRAAGGFVDATRVSRAEGQISSAVIVVRVPTTAFGALVPQLRALGEVQAESTDAADITAAYVDTAGRLTGARALEQRLLELAATGTGSVSEVLEVERELSRIRGEIEQLEGQLRVWNDQVALSTLTLTLSTQRPELAAAAAPSFGHRVGQAWHDSIAALGAAAEGLSIGLIALLPWLPLLAPLLFFGVRFRRRRVRLPRAVVYMPAAYAPPPSPPSPGLQAAPPMSPPAATSPLP